MTTPMRPFRVPFSPPPSRPHHPNRLDHQLARAAVGWCIWGDVDLEEVAERLVALAGGNRTAVERALRRFRSLDGGILTEPALEEAGTTAGRAAVALRLALARGHWSG